MLFLITRYLPFIDIPIMMYSKFPKRTLQPS